MSDELFMGWGSIDLHRPRVYGQVARRLPPPLDRLEEGDCVAIREIENHNNGYVYLSMSHPLLSCQPPRAWTAVWTVQLDGDWFVLLNNNAFIINDPPLDDEKYPPQQVLKLNGENKALEILSPETFFAAVLEMQKKIDARVCSSGDDYNFLLKQDLAQVFSPIFAHMKGKEIK
jgi:hypothetical protein